MTFWGSCPLKCSKPMTFWGSCPPSFCPSKFWCWHRHCVHCIFVPSENILYNGYFCSNKHILVALLRILVFCHFATKSVLNIICLFFLQLSLHTEYCMFIFIQVLFAFIQKKCHFIFKCCTFHKQKQTQQLHDIPDMKVMKLIWKLSLVKIFQYVCRLE